LSPAEPNPPFAEAFATAHLTRSRLIRDLQVAKQNTANG
jgi:hypothetical protein